MGPQLTIPARHPVAGLLGAHSWCPPATPAFCSTGSFATSSSRFLSWATSLAHPRAATSQILTPQLRPSLSHSHSLATLLGRLMQHVPS